MMETAKIKTLIVDGEVPARRGMRRLLAFEGDVEVVGECAGSQEAIAFIQERHPDLVFLGLRTPETDGFSVVESLPTGNPPSVVFVSEGDQYAARAFDVHAVDYLLKPLDAARIRRALDRARVQIRQRNGSHLDQRLSTLANTLGARTRQVDRLVIKSAGRIMFLRTDKIDWIEAADNYVKLHVGVESHLLRETLGSLEARLDGAKFVRIHRSTLVNIDRMREMQPWFHGDYVVILEDGTRLNLSRTYRNEVIETIGRIF